MKRSENITEQSVDQQTRTNVTITVTQPNRESRNQKYTLREGVGVQVNDSNTNKGFLKESATNDAPYISVEVNFFL